MKGIFLPYLGAFTIFFASSDDMDSKSFLVNIVIDGWLSNCIKLRLVFSLCSFRFRSNPTFNLRRRSKNTISLFYLKCDPQHIYVLCVKLQQCCIGGNNLVYAQVEIHSKSYPTQLKLLNSVNVEIPNKVHIMQCVITFLFLEIFSIYFLGR